MSNVIAARVRAIDTAFPALVDATSFRGVDGSAEELSAIRELVSDIKTATAKDLVQKVKDPAMRCTLRSVFISS